MSSLGCQDLPDLIVVGRVLLDPLPILIVRHFLSHKVKSLHLLPELRLYHLVQHPLRCILKLGVVILHVPISRRVLINLLEAMEALPHFDPHELFGFQRHFHSKESRSVYRSLNMKESFLLLDVEELGYGDDLSVCDREGHVYPHLHTLPCAGEELEHIHLTSLVHHVLEEVALSKEAKHVWQRSMDDRTTLDCYYSILIILILKSGLASVYTHCPAFTLHINFFEEEAS